MKKNARELSLVPFTFESSHEGTWSHENIRSACLLTIAEELRGINRRLDLLGVDGIHDVIKHHARKAKDVERLRYERAKAARRRDREARTVCATHGGRACGLREPACKRKLLPKVKHGR